MTDIATRRLMSLTHRAEAQYGSIEVSGVVADRRLDGPFRTTIEPTMNSDYPSHWHARLSSPKIPLSDDEAEAEEELGLPVAPDEGTPLIPDDERVVNVPS